MNCTDESAWKREINHDCLFIYAYTVFLQRGSYDAELDHINRGPWRAKETGRKCNIKSATLQFAITMTVFIF